MYVSPGLAYCLPGLRRSGVCGVQPRVIGILPLATADVHGTVVTTPQSYAHSVHVRLAPASLTFEALKHSYSPHDIWPPTHSLRKSDRHLQAIDLWLGCPSERHPPQLRTGIQSDRHGQRRECETSMYCVMSLTDVMCGSHSWSLAISLWRRHAWDSQSRCRSRPISP
eukprot:COSAG01_NODE_2112_length_8403_cov_15.894027_4_plen_168_part_00